jgi:Flp pilus assembly protein TadD
MRLAATYARAGDLDSARARAALALSLAPGFDFVEAARVG